ncbi:DUF1003 domain-containing protein [Mesorhizobium sp.]|uniref:DUF1003 domain-containing protein n=1 Tax=Mesorhizobium sp. TaxID=1871066 RepID=UPI000FE32934|nr:DUF1003 domain-containing protein [Mesorhizobium sp.]RWN50518.1 MAG: DUF1003 domain-containing protein [Mesorhizobium sp.]RWN70970.1 MAG: DUF1003 domain-containing protein [Mesorhizobium sp.]RWN71011.1 MAG: DUF1003 domain-containing protein [Mesorhizobium sp.]RWN82508.1 MAG: DUF1003 domain-containing protein [Mesorhizobium sp.]RWO06969.1 MAG: DUF1003 domain-containing protein [Mesorhizobium sp.]
MDSPTLPPPPPTELSQALKRNIHAIEERWAKEASEATLEEKIAQAITSFTGSMRFVYLHLAVYGCWIVSNLGWIPITPPFDPTFVILAMVASVEAIFLSTFVLISQNRMSAAADKRADLDLQVSLLTEHELTNLAELVDSIADRLNVKPALSDIEVGEIKRDIAPEAVLDEIESKQLEAAEKLDQR